MTAAELAAYLGAAAWFPQIASWVYRRYVQPVVNIVPDRYAEVGFTSYGPIFNVRMAFSVDKKDLVIDGFELVLAHSDGDVHVLRWAGLQETFSEITDNAGNRQIVSRDQSPIAIKVGTESLIEKFVRFQEPRYFETTRPAILDLVAHFNFLKKSDPTESVAKLLSSKELFELVEARKKSFWWKPGHYEITVGLSALRPFKFATTGFHFDLTALEVDRLEQNLGTLEAELQNTISSNLPDFRAKPVVWNWANVDVRKSE